jgi:hypothetical protein
MLYAEDNQMLAKQYDCICKLLTLTVFWIHIGPWLKEAILTKQ